MEKVNCIFIKKWGFAITFGAFFSFIGIIGAFIHNIPMIFFFGIVGVFWLIWFALFVPHAFAFDDKRILAIYVFEKKYIHYTDIKSYDLQESGIRNYPWGKYYHIIADKPDWNEIKIPWAKEIQCLMNTYVKKN